MASDTFGFLVDQNTLIAVILGAILATIGGFVATATERFLDKRERERNAALFFGEVLSTLMVILSFAEDTKKVGDPFGPITMRMLHSARREIDIYDRNRETLFYLGDAELRTRIQNLVIRLGMALDSNIEAVQDIDALRRQIVSVAPGEEREDIQARIARNESRRDGSYEFIQQIAAQLRDVIAGLEPFARQSFDRLHELARSI